WRPQVERLEDRLAPTVAAPPILPPSLPSGIPVVTRTFQQDASTPSLVGVLRLDAAEPGLSGAGRGAAVLRFKGDTNPLPALEYFDTASQTWKPAQGSTRVAGSLRIDPVHQTITLILDQSSAPALPLTDSLLLRLTPSHLLDAATVTALSVTPEGVVSPPHPNPSGFVSGFVEHRLPPANPMLD